jgi:hypothetical protein
MFQRTIVLSLLVVSTLCFSLRQSQAALISTSQMFEQVSIEQKRAQVIGFLNRSDVEQQLAKLGVSAEEARTRAQFLTDSEIQNISSKIDQLPAGQDGFGSVLGFVLVIFIILLITDILHLTKVFPFTK